MAESLAGVAGRQARKRVGRRALGVWEAPANRADPVAILEQQAATRVPELVPIRYARMAAGRFPFLRGAPAIMAADLAAVPDTGLTVQLCGDAHLSNFGLFASPERALVFDLNDFDETLPGPFEWDVKRLSASIAVAARANGFADTDAETSVGAAASAYRATMGRLAGLGELAVWYEMIDADKLAALAQKPKRRKGVEQALADARSRTNLQALEKLTEPDADGVPRIRHRPPLLTPIEQVDADTVRRVFADFRRTLAEERRVLLDRHEMLDVAVKVVGVGSVGTRCFVALLAGRESRSPLFLQVKEAQESVLARHTGPSKFRNQGHRVVHGQRLTQAASDIFLGWAAGSDGRHYYCRQLRDMKGSATIEEMSRRYLRDYSALCGHTLARAHARSGDRVAIAAYLGTSDAFDRAMIDFALAYADRTADDHQILLAAIESGRVVAADKAY
ncbi:DUF2252 domain-containing protein [Nocardia brasiliensis]|uniref:DUF2252 domain-containing protein n=1 Tax=Nocardia brasiliensis (strain ATCC 700358 / HUJEG-1) TaxID=1133849 RepID=K0EUU8_NOCB7|nr:DUF2252 domain-containing protein [Nocardia brasiliensis]AFT99350.1 hypothetical protein O3I_006940 [Nocardia brasiliensis ATCC 700358]OCF90321.1 hypothetical protein AW168_10045 [Nocardia brasiliensis]